MSRAARQLPTVLRKAAGLLGAFVALAGVMLGFAFVTAQPAYADDSVCLRIPRDLQGVQFRVYCAGQPIVTRENHADCETEPGRDNHYQNNPGNRLSWFCDRSQRVSVEDWIHDHPDQNGNPHPAGISDDPCVALPEEEREGCADIRESDFRDVTTHPCMWPAPGTDRPILTTSDQAWCFADNSWFLDDELQPGRGDNKFHDPTDYSASAGLADQLDKGIGWAKWVGTTCCGMFLFAFLYDVLTARNNGTAVLGSGFYIFAGVFVVGGAPVFVYFLLIGGG